MATTTSTTASLRRNHSTASSNGNKKRKSSDASETKTNDITTITTTAVIQTTQLPGASRQSSIRRNPQSASPIATPSSVDDGRRQPARIETVSEKRNGADGSLSRASGLRCHLPSVSIPDTLRQSPGMNSPIELTEVDLTTVEEVPVLQRLPSVSPATAATRPKKPQRVCKVL